MLSSIGQPEATLESLSGVIGQFNKNSIELIHEYQRLEERVNFLRAQLQTKNQELENSLREREEARAYLLSVLESLKAGVLVLDQDFHPTFLNRRLTELTGPVDDQWLPQLLGDRLMQRLRWRDKTVMPLECERIIQGPGGLKTAVQLSLSEVQIKRGRSHFVAIFQDLTTIKKLEAEAARTRRLASLGVMASEVAHQVKNPLGGIELCASLLKDCASGNPRRLADEILQAVRRLSTTLADLLAFAAEPSIAADILPVPMLMKDLMEECIPLFDDPLWSVVFQIQPELPPVSGDRGLLVQAVLNLIVNGKEAMPNGGTVTVKVQTASIATPSGQVQRGMEIRVMDEGVGISTENRERIFDPFFTTKKQGTGLGLALTHKIVSAHRGSIEIVGVTEGGSEFVVSLPHAEDI